jgi:hypothetical protein
MMVMPVQLIRATLLLDVFMSLLHVLSPPTFVSSLPHATHSLEFVDPLPLVAMIQRIVLLILVILSSVVFTLPLILFALILIHVMLTEFVDLVLPPMLLVACTNH